MGAKRALLNGEPGVLGGLVEVGDEIAEPGGHDIEPKYCRPGLVGECTESAQADTYCRTMGSRIDRCGQLFEANRIRGAEEAKGDVPILRRYGSPRDGESGETVVQGKDDFWRWNESSKEPLVDHSGHLPARAKRTSCSAAVAA